MTRIVIEPGPLELGLYEEAYEALLEDLRERGFEAEIRRPVEQRFGLPQEIVNTALWVSETIGEETVGIIMHAFLQRMRKSRRPRKKPPPVPPVAILYGPDGEPLRRVEIPEADV
jgi:hypothetical protein